MCCETRRNGKKNRKSLTSIHSQATKTATETQDKTKTTTSISAESRSQKPEKEKKPKPTTNPANPRRTKSGDKDSVKGGAKVSAEVAEVMINFIDKTVKMGFEGLKKEFLKLGASKMQASLAFKENERKNRYTNIPCFDSTRVVLKYNVPPDSDYIHANYVKSNIASLSNNFICTQAPMENTINDFWRMIWQEKPNFIIMLCKLLENNMPKCSLYWPEKKGESKTYGKITVTNEGSAGEGNEKVFDIDRFRVQASGDESAIYVKHIRWLDWPDFGIPQTGLGILRVLRAVDKGGHGTTIIHCSAGIGRTGTVLAAEILMKALTAGTKVKVPEVIQNLREQRFGLVQTNSQYIYLHVAICSYCERKLENYPPAADALKSFKIFNREYTKFAKKEEAEDRTLAAKGCATRQATNVRQ